MTTRAWFTTGKGMRSIQQGMREYPSYEDGGDDDDDGDKDGNTDGKTKPGGADVDNFMKKVDDPDYEPDRDTDSQLPIVFPPPGTPPN